MITSSSRATFPGSGRVGRVNKSPEGRRRESDSGAPGNSDGAAWDARVAVPASHAAR
eukprot:CAMPEP_0198706438 /NCGR_PEP_ID=MMETSP1468-20131203/390967_1 /TAXON_ID=1461545 /ORGANISM="Mantoniella sp, Strain CCMP1436" /LENGTH=56 /DNA_ID=CAMNT_0044465383 /DNA_START=244 /DNA_END=414 /DNA_ORIENTATION=-